MDYIRKGISSASFVVIILDGTSGVMSKSQLSTLLSLVYNGKVHERFVRYVDVSPD